MSGSIDSQSENNLVESSIQPLHSTPSKKSNEESPPENITTYHDSFESASTKKSSDNANGSRQISIVDLTSIEEETQSPPAKSLSAWEKWLCSKEEEKRRHLQELNKERQKKQIEKRIKEERKLEKELRAEIAHEKWLKRIEDEQRKHNKIKKEKAEQERKIQEEKEQKIKEAAVQKYNDWKNTKDKLKEEKQREEKAKMKARVEKLEEKKQLNSEAFNKWLKNVSRRPKLQSSVGYGYAGGVLISYQDGTSSPRPSYCNPNPWVSCTDNDC